MKTLKTIGKVLLYIIAGILILLFIAGIFIDPIAKRVLENQVSNVGEGQYSLALDEVDISILGGSVSLQGVQFKTDTAHYETPPIAFLNADEIAIEGVSWLTYLLNQKLLTDRVLLDNITIGLYARSINEGGQQDTTTQQSPFRLEQLDIYPAIRDQVDRARLKDMVLNEISLTLVNLDSQDTLAFNARELNLQSDDILIDANKLITDNRAFYATEIDFLAKGLEVVRSGNKKFESNIDIFNFRTDEQKMGIEVNGVNFLESNVSQTDTLLFVSLQEFELSELDMKRVQDDQTAPIKKISLQGMRVVNQLPPPPDTATQAEKEPLNLAEFSLGENLPEAMDRVELVQLDIGQIFVQQGDSIRVEDFNLNATQIIIDEQSAFANNRFLHAATMSSKLEGISASVGNPELNIHLADFSMDVENGIGNMGFRQLQAVSEEKIDNEMWVEAEIGPFNLISLNTRKVTEGHLGIDSIAIENPVVALNLPAQQAQNQAGQEAQNQSSEGFTPPDLYPAIEGMLNSFSLGKFALIGADITVSGMEAVEKDLHIPAIYLQLRDVLIAEGTAYEGKRVLHTEDVAFRVEDIQFPVDEVYTFTLDMARFSTFEQFMEARGITYGYGNNAEAVFENHETNQLLNVANRHFRINQLDFQRMLKEQAFFASSIEADGFELFAYSNANYSSGGTSAEEEAADKAKEEAEKVAASMPQTQLKQIDMPIYVGRFKLNSANITYKQMASEADSAGIMEITDFYANVRNLTNVQNKLRQKPEIELETGGMIMGSGPFELQVSMDMVSESKDVQIAGSIDTLDVTELNRFTEYTSRLGFDSGEIYAVNWDIEADEEEATGTLEMSYDNLDIRISESNTPDDSGLLKNVAGFLANNLVLESDVAEKSSEEPAETEISEERGEDEDFPGYILKALVWGFVDIMVTIF